MPHMREVKTCDRCRQFKRRCDLLKPSCSRCLQAGVQCSFDTAAAVAAAVASSTTAASTPVSATASATTPATSSAPTSASTAVFPPTPKLEHPPQAGLYTYPSISSSPVTPHEVPATPGSIESDPGASEFAADEIQLPTRRRSQQVLIQRVVRKRKRNCLSCLRCHRLKVKCDKELPCGRCKSSGNGGDCYYSYNKGPNSGKFPCPTLTPAVLAQLPPSGDNARGTGNGWQITHKVRSGSHWKDLMAKLGALIKLDSPKLAEALGNVASNACLSSFALPGNFPFGTPGASKYYARDAVARLLETERANCPDYIQRYVDLLDTVNPVLDLPKFYQEVEQYWEDPSSVSLCWLSMFLMVLGLGCFSTAEEPYQATELMMAAEACLVQTPFMFRPTLVTLRALTLMVVAKHVCNATCWACDSCWSLLGMVVRTAFIYGLPKATYAGDGSTTPDLAERETQQKLWLTITYLDIKVSMTAGMPLLTRPEQIEGLNLLLEGALPNSFSSLLYQSLPIVLTIMDKLNHHGGQLPYPEVIEYNTRLREILPLVHQVCSSHLQRVTVDTMLRRTLMVLHRPYALHEQGPVLYPVSYWASLECSLALLMHYRELFAAEPSLRYDLIGRAFVLDFFSATLTSFVHVLRKDAPLSGAAATGCDVQIPPRQLIIDTLRGNIDIWKGEADKSVCWQTGLNILNGVLDALPEISELETGTG